MISPSRPRPLKWRVLDRLLHGAVRRLNLEGPDFVTLHRRPKASADHRLPAERDIAREPMAVVMQGPIYEAYDFTRETLALYRRIHPDYRLVLSTWSDTPAHLLEPIRALGVDIVLNQKPGVPGLYNLNLQITTAAAGVRRAVADGAQWILKTRTDQRLYEPDALDSLLALARSFPVGGDAVGGDAVGGTRRQRHRIIGVGHGTLKYVPYHMTDQTVFGHADDMQVYWCPALQLDPPPAHYPSSAGDIHLHVTLRDLMKHGIAECFFATRFLTATGWDLKWTIADSWAAFRDRFCVADYALTDFFWVKVQTGNLAEYPKGYSQLTNRRELDFGAWLQLHSELLRPEAASRYEAALGDCFWQPLRIQAD